MSDMWQEQTVESKIEEALQKSYQTEGEIDRKIESLGLKFMDLVNVDTKDDYRKLINSLRELKYRRRNPEAFISPAQKEYIANIEKNLEKAYSDFRDLSYILIMTGDWDSLSSETKECIRCMFGVE